MTRADIVDVRGLSLTAPSSEAVERFDALMNDLYYYRLGVQDRLAALIEEFPEFPLAHVLMGFSLMTEGTLDSQPRARKYLNQAEALPANRRERLHQEAACVDRAGLCGSRRGLGADPDGVADRLARVPSIHGHAVLEW